MLDTSTRTSQLGTIDMLERVFASRSPWMSKARSVGLTALNRSNILKEWMMNAVG